MSITSMINRDILLVAASVPAINAFQVEVAWWKKDVLNLTVTLEVSTHMNFKNIVAPLSIVFSDYSDIHYTLTS